MEIRRRHASISLLFYLQEQKGGGIIA